jgi:hypothetical protein
MTSSSFSAFTLALLALGASACTFSNEEPTGSAALELVSPVAPSPASSPIALLAEHAGPVVVVADPPTVIAGHAASAGRIEGLELLHSPPPGADRAFPTGSCLWPTPCATTTLHLPPLRPTNGCEGANCAATRAAIEERTKETDAPVDAQTIHAAPHGLSEDAPSL